jgi:hypothetical protein
MVYRSIVVLVLSVLSTFAFAATEKISNVQYGVLIEAPQPVGMSNGMTVMSGGLFHSNVVQADGSVSSQWCRGSTAMMDDKPVSGGGFCTIIADNGDLLWVWFGNGDWGVIGGTGQYDGATGGGKTEPVSQNADGRSFVNKSTGEITTK